MSTVLSSPITCAGLNFPFLKKECGKEIGKDGTRNVAYAYKKEDVHRCEDCHVAILNAVHNKDLDEDDVW